MLLRSVTLPCCRLGLSEVSHTLVPSELSLLEGEYARGPLIAKALLLRHFEDKSISRNAGKALRVLFHNVHTLVPSELPLLEEEYARVPLIAKALLLRHFEDKSISRNAGKALRVFHNLKEFAAKV